MSNETVTLTRETYHDLIDNFEALKALQKGLPVLVSTVYNSSSGLGYIRSCEILYEGDEQLKEMVKATSAEYLEYREKFHKKSGALNSVKRSLKSSIRFTWFWFFVSIGITVIHFIK
jgi:hypothetical protein